MRSGGEVVYSVQKFRTNLSRMCLKTVKSSEELASGFNLRACCTRDISSALEKIVRNINHALCPI
jgi:hypothetical protein